MTATADPAAIVAHYEHIFRFPFLLVIQNRADRRELESLKDTCWYANGYYDQFGCDRHGRTYATTDDDGAACADVVAGRREANAWWDFQHSQ